MKGKYMGPQESIHQLRPKELTRLSSYFKWKTVCNDLEWWDYWNSHIQFSCFVTEPEITQTFTGYKIKQAQTYKLFCSHTVRQCLSVLGQGSRFKTWSWNGFNTVCWQAEKDVEMSWCFLETGSPNHATGFVMFPCSPRPCYLHQNQFVIVCTVLAKATDTQHVHDTSKQGVCWDSGLYRSKNIIV